MAEVEHILQFDFVGPVTRSTGEEVQRRDPARAVASLIGNPNVETLFSGLHVDVEIACRFGHPVAVVFAHTGSVEASMVTWGPDDGTRVTERALWLAWRPGLHRVERIGIPPRSLTLWHYCLTADARRALTLRVDLERVRKEIDDMWEVGRVASRRILW